MKPFEESYFSQLITRKLQKADLSHEENDYITSCLLSEDPVVSDRCREIISNLLEKHSPSLPPSDMPGSEVNREYQQLMASMRHKKSLMDRTYIITAVLLALLFIVLIVIFLLS